MLTPPSEAITLIIPFSPMPDLAAITQDSSLFIITMPAPIESFVNDSWRRMLALNAPVIFWYRNEPSTTSSLISLCPGTATCSHPGLVTPTSYDPPIMPGSFAQDHLVDSEGASNSSVASDMEPNDHSANVKLHLTPGPSTCDS